MTDRLHPACDRTRPMAFLLWGWALLLLVLLSAAPSSAQAGTRLIGSAFDPSTVSVTVGPNKRDDHLWIKRLRSDGPDGDTPARAPGLLLLVAAKAMLPAPASAVVPPWAGMTLQRVVWCVPPRTQPARAPPKG